MVMVNRIHCDEMSLGKLLSGELNTARQAAVAAHLDTCPSCCEALQRLAAEPDWWDALANHLQDVDPPGPTGAGVRSSTSPEDGDRGGDTVPLRNDHESENPPGVSMMPELVIDFLQPPVSGAYLGRLGRYDVEGVIGRGGMGVVLRGFEANLNRSVAIKVLAPHVAGSGAARKRFAREARAAAAVVHPHVIPIYGVEPDGKLPYLVMPYIDGTSLQHRLTEFGPLDLIDIIRIAQQTASGLAAAHAQGLVHRDVKPANILLEHQLDRVLLTDFGLARAVDDVQLTASGWIAGTPPYMSPEQAHGDMVDHRSDLFSLGSVMYAMCTGEAPFQAASSVAVLRKVCDQKPRDLRHLNPAIPGWLVRLIDRLHEKNPARRFQSAQEVSDLLERCLAHLQQPMQVGLPRELRATGRWRTMAVLLVSAGVLSGAVASRVLDQLPAWFAFPAAQISAEEQQAAEAGSVDMRLASEGDAIGRVVRADAAADDLSWTGQLQVELGAIDDQLRELERQFP